SDSPFTTSETVASTHVSPAHDEKQHRNRDEHQIQSIGSPQTLKTATLWPARASDWANLTSALGHQRLFAATTTIKLVVRPCCKPMSKSLAITTCTSTGTSISRASAASSRSTNCGATSGRSSGSGNGTICTANSVTRAPRWRVSVEIALRETLVSSRVVCATNTRNSPDGVLDSANLLSASSSSLITGLPSSAWVLATAVFQHEDKPEAIKKSLRKS